MRALFFWFAAAALAGVPGHSQSLSGRVADPSGAPVSDARVHVVARNGQSRATVQTGSDGKYSFPALAAGEYLVEARAEGFGASEPLPVRISAEGASLDLTLDLPRLSTAIQVTAAGTAQTVDEQSKALDIIDAPQIAARAEITVAEALRTTPGVRVQQLGGPASFTRVLTRGGRAYDTSVLVDGFRFRDAAAPQGDAAGLIGDLLLTNSDRIEVLRGSGSSLYGTHATGGVVNIITDQGGGDPHGELSAEGGGLGLFRGLARMSGSGLDQRLRYSGGVSHLNVSSGLDENDHARNSSVNGFAQFNLTPVTFISARVLGSGNFVQLNDAPSAAGALPPGDTIRAQPGVTFTPAPDDPDDRRDGRTTMTLVSFSHAWSADASVRAAYNGLATRRNNFDGPGGRGFQPETDSLYRFDGRIDTAQARTDLRLGRRHTVSAGYEWERERYSDLTRVGGPDARLRIHQASHALFAQDQIQFLDRRLQVSLSGRTQGFELDRPSVTSASAPYADAAISKPPRAWTGDASAAYLIARTGTKLRGHIGNGYRAPALYERFGASFFLGSFSPYGDPGLRPERVLAFDAGLDQYFASSRARLSATYFYTESQQAIIFDFSGSITPDTDPFGRFGGYRNTNGGLSRGVELSIEATPTRSLIVRSSYTYTNADERRSLYGNSVIRSARISTNMFSATASQRFGRAFDLTFDIFAASSYLVPLSGRAFEFEGPVKADVVASYTRALSDRHSVRVFTRVENVLNRRYYEDGFRTPRAWAVGGLKWLF